MALIRTTKKGRLLFEEHLAQLDKLADSKPSVRRGYQHHCYMCDAAETKKGDNICKVCPLSSDIHDGVDCVRERTQHLRDNKNKKTYLYHHAKPATIRKHADWIADQITKYTDCEMV